MKTTFALAALAAAASAEMEPKTKAVLESSVIDLGIAQIGWNLNGDIGYGWEWPLYNDGNSLVWRPRIFAFGGGKQQLSLTSEFVSVNFYWETMVGKLTLDPYFKMSLDDYSDRCTAGTWLIDMFRSALYMDLFWLECNWGVLGFVLSNDSVCGQK